MNELIAFLKRLRAIQRRRARQSAAARHKPAPYCEILGGAAFEPLPPAGRVLILKLDHIGDFVLSLPAMVRLREVLADAHITLVCGSWNRELVSRSAVANDVIVFDFLPSRGGDAGDGPIPDTQYKAFQDLATQLGRFDLAVDMRFWADTRPLLAMVDAKVRAGFADMWAKRSVLDISVAASADLARDPRTGLTLHEQTRAHILVAAILDTLRPPARPASRLLTPASSMVSDARYLVVAPGAGTSIKVWSSDRLGQAVSQIAESHDLKVVILALAAEAPLSSLVSRSISPERLIDMTGRTTLIDIPAILDRAQLYVGMDSGLTHLAAGLEVPTVCVFSGATSLAAWRPLGPSARVVRGGAACSPCFLAHRDQCPHSIACLEAVDVAAVVSAAEAALATRRAGR